MKYLQPGPLASLASAMIFRRAADTHDDGVDAARQEHLTRHYIGGGAAVEVGATRAAVGLLLVELS